MNCPPFMTLAGGVVTYASLNTGTVYTGNLSYGFDAVGYNGAGAAVAGAGAVAFNSYQSWPAQWYPATSGANTFCNPQLYANKTVVCPFKISVMSQSSLNSLNLISGNAFPPFAYNNGAASRGALVLGTSTAMTGAPGDPSASNFWLTQFPQCINYVVWAANGMVRVNEESGAPKALDWPQVNAVSQAYYWQLVQASMPIQCDWVWRIVLLFGFFPASCTMYIRATFPETPRFTLHKEGNLEKLAKDMASVSGQEMDATHTVTAHGKEITFGMFMKRHGVELLGCAMCWCLLDVAFYSQGLFQKDIFTQINWLPGAAAMNALTETFKIARAQALIALGSTIPGYWFTVATVDYLGRLKIQLLGFVLMTAFMAGLCGGYYQLLDRSGSKSTSLAPTVGVNGFVVLYALTFFFANFGPNATTFVIPAELFPTVWKTTAHGFSAACGKAGAIVGAFGFLYSAKPVFGEYSWSANYGGPGWWSWTWKPNCPGGLGSKSFAGNGWDPAAPLIWGPCVHHPNKIWFNGTQNYKFLNPTNMSGVLCAANVLGCNDITGYRPDGYPNWVTNPYANVPLPTYQLAQTQVASQMISIPTAGGGSVTANWAGILFQNAVVGYAVALTSVTVASSSSTTPALGINSTWTSFTTYPASAVSAGSVNLTTGVLPATAYVQTTVTNIPVLTAAGANLMTTYGQNQKWDGIIPYSWVASNCLSPGPNVLPTKSQTSGTILCQYGQHTGYQNSVNAYAVATAVVSTPNPTPFPVVNQDIYSYSRTALTPCNATGLLGGNYSANTPSYYSGFNTTTGALIPVTPLVTNNTYFMPCKPGAYNPSSVAQNWWGNNRATSLGGFGVISDTWSSQPLPTPIAQYFPYGVGLQASLGILAGTNFLGMLFTFVLPETNGKTLEELSGETENPDA